jgi:hypothetical protein
MGKAIMKLTQKAVTKLTKSVRKVTRKVMRKVKTRRAKRRTMKGGDYETSIVNDEVELVPILKEDSKDLSVSVPGFGTIGMKAYRQYMQDLDTRGSAQM